MSAPMPDAVWAIPHLHRNRLQWGKRGVSPANDTRCCKHCRIELLTGERSGWCCGSNGDKLALYTPLPPLPVSYGFFTSDPTISEKSRYLNLIFSFAAMEATGTVNPPEAQGFDGNFAILGKPYHRVRPSNNSSGVRWALYDGYMLQKAPGYGRPWFSQVPELWIHAFINVLMVHNPLVQQLQRLALQNDMPHAHLIVQDSGTDEIAAIMSFSDTSHRQMKLRHLVITRLDTSKYRVSAVSRLWEPLVYPLLFPHGTLGWGVTSASDFGPAPNRVEADVAMSQMWHYRMRLLHDERFRIFGRLTNEYIVDMFCRILETRLQYIRENHNNVQREDAALMGVPAVPDTENIYLPSSFLGSRRWASEQISDALTVGAHYGAPTHFVTVTCNPFWPEIQERLRPGQKWTDDPILVARVFKQKLSALLRVLKTMFPNAGKHLYIIYSVEFQKRGLPHAHILIKFARDCISPDDINSVVSAEMPDDPADRLLVQTFMLHHHSTDENGRVVVPRYCRKKNDADNKRDCRHGFPKPLQEETSLGLDGRVMYRRRKEEDRMVVPHCLPLLRAFQCHINFEIAGSSHLFQYLFKYIHKGVDTARVRVTADNPSPDVVDETEEFWNARYLSAGEAAWRILGNHVARKEPSVTALPVHLQGSRAYHQYKRKTVTTELSDLDRYFHRPIGSYTDGGVEHAFADLTYAKYYALFRFEKLVPDRLQMPGIFLEHGIVEPERPRMVIQRSKAEHLTRLATLRPSQGEVYYLRAILQHRPVTSWEDARTVDGVAYPSYQEAASAAGLFNDEQEADCAMLEAVQALRTPRELRMLFVHLLVNDCCRQPLATWTTFREPMTKDYFFRLNGHDELATDQTLLEIGRALEEHGRTLAFYGLPQVTQTDAEVIHELSRWAGEREHMRSAADDARQAMTDEQAPLFDRIAQSMASQEPCFEYVDGKAGRGKTFVISALCDYARARDWIVLATASTAHAAQLYKGGRTAHATFGIPVVENNELLRSTIEPDTHRANLIREARLIILDEAPMSNQAVLSCVHDLCQRIMGNDLPFGGKTVLLAGDFRQTCPVIRKGTKADVLRASIKSSPLWSQFNITELTIPIRNAEDPEFAAWVDGIGDGAGPDISTDLVEKTDSMADLLDFVFPDDILRDPTACFKRSILCPTNLQIDEVNNTLLQRVTGEERTYFAADSLKEAEEAGLESDDAILDYAAKRTPPGLPPFALTVKTNAMYRMMRNFSPQLGLVKNARVVVKDVGRRIVTVRLLRSVDGRCEEGDEDILIPRITFEQVLPVSGHTLQRRQFPLAPAYATTFNSCQGLTLDRAGVDLTRDVFSHGQLYTAVSRVRCRSALLLRLRPGESRVPNITYLEILE